MKRWIAYFILLLLSLWLGLKIQADPGLVFIRYQQWQIETTLWFALFAFLIFWVVLQSVSHFLAVLIRLPKKIARYLDQRAKRHSQQDMIRGFCYLVEENGAAAAKYFVKAAKQNQLPFMNYLLAAEAALLENNTRRRARYLKEAERYATDLNLKETWTLFEAKQDLMLGEEATALSKFRALYEKKRRYPVILKRLKDIYLKTQDWDALSLLLPDLKKISSLDAFSCVQTTVYEGQLKHCVSKNQGLDHLQKLWKKIPTPLRSHSALCMAYVEGLVHYDAPIQAEKVLRAVIKQHNDPQLMAYYAALDQSGFRK